MSEVVRDPVDKKLDEVAIHQMLFKSDKMKAAVLTILYKAVRDGSFWADEVVFDFLGPEDRNVIGTAFRILGEPALDESGKAKGPGLSLIRRLRAENRRSKAKGRNGGVVFRYVLHSENANTARTLVRKYDLAKAKELAAPPAPWFREFLI